MPKLILLLLLLTTTLSYSFTITPIKPPNTTHLYFISSLTFKTNTTQAKCIENCYLKKIVKDFIICHKNYTTLEDSTLIYHFICDFDDAIISSLTDIYTFQYYIPSYYINYHVTCDGYDEKHLIVKDTCQLTYYVNDLYKVVYITIPIILVFFSGILFLYYFFSINQIGR